MSTVPGGVEREWDTVPMVSAHSVGLGALAAGGTYYRHHPVVMEAAVTPEEIIRSCKHCLGGACTACISSALEEARLAAVTAYASGHAHVCQNAKLKPVPETSCSAGCGIRPRRSLREVAMMLDGRVKGWTTAKAAVMKVLANAEDARKDVETLGIPEAWSRLYAMDLMGDWSIDETGEWA